MELTIAIVGSCHSGKSLFIKQAETIASTYAHHLIFVEVNDLELFAKEGLCSVSNSNNRTTLLRPDVIIQVVDCGDLEESLVFTPQLIDMHQKLVLALNHYDVLLATQHQIDYTTFGKLLGVQARPTNATNGHGIYDVLQCAVDAFENKENTSRHIHVQYGTDTEESVDRLVRLLNNKSNRDFFVSHPFSRRHLAVRLLEYGWLDILDTLPNRDELQTLVVEERSNLEHELKASPAAIIHEARHGFIHGALSKTLQHNGDSRNHSRLEKIDAVLTNKWLGFPILIGLLYIVFQCTFTLGAYPQQWISNGIDGLCIWIETLLPSGWFASMMIDGVLQGVGAVLAFLPNIVILFFFLSLMEDSGYMARAAYLMDGIMHKVGLHGRSFVPMLVGFGCNVPAIMAARALDNPKDRTLTMLMIPFMSCSARLPVYLLLVSVFFPNHKAIVMISLYMVGIMLSILFALVMKNTRFFRKPDEDYVSELPMFRTPTWRNTGLHIWERVSDYLKKISTVILAASVIIWALNYFPLGCSPDESYLAMIGKWLAPVMAPLGFDWRMNVCILTGLPAKEAIVSTMGILYGNELANVFTPVSAYAFMIFVLLYFPCIATIATLRREIGRPWAIFVVIHSLLLAWLLAFFVVHIFG